MPRTSPSRTSIRESAGLDQRRLPGDPITPDNLAGLPRTNATAPIALLRTNSRRPIMIVPPLVSMKRGYKKVRLQSRGSPWFAGNPLRLPGIAQKINFKPNSPIRPL